MIQRYKVHVCLDQKYCGNCKTAVEIDHKCFILTIQEENIRNKRKSTNFNGFVFYDFEAYVDPETEYHVVNLAMANKVCVECIDIIRREDRCPKCTTQYKHYNIHDFVEWMLSEENQHCIFIAHNAKGKIGDLLLKRVYN